MIMAKTKKICPRCMGNGYFKVMESPQFKRDVIVQCPMCNSEGEIDAEKADNVYIDSDGIHRLQ